MHVVRYKRGLCSLPFNLRYFDDTTLISGRFSDSGRIEVARHNQLEPDSLVTKVKETIHEEVEESADGSGLIFKWEMDEEVDSYEMTELPQLSRGKYIHDFKMNKTLILDDENDRCFIMELNRNEIKPPRDFMEFISRLENGIYQLNLNEVRHDTRVVFPPLDNVSWLKYGCVFFLNHFQSMKSLQITLIPESPLQTIARNALHTSWRRWRKSWKNDQLQKSLHLPNSLNLVETLSSPTTLSIRKRCRSGTMTSMLFCSCFIHFTHASVYKIRKRNVIFENRESLILN